MGKTLSYFYLSPLHTAFQGADADVAVANALDQGSAVFQSEGKDIVGGFPAPQDLGDLAVAGIII